MLGPGADKVVIDEFGLLQLLREAHIETATLAELGREYTDTRSVPELVDFIEQIDDVEPHRQRLGVPRPPGVRAQFQDWPSHKAHSAPEDAPHRPEKRTGRLVTQAVRLHLTVSYLAATWPGGSVSPLIRSLTSLSVLRLVSISATGVSRNTSAAMESRKLSRSSTS